MVNDASHSLWETFWDSTERNADHTTHDWRRGKFYNAHKLTNPAEKPNDIRVKQSRRILQFHGETTATSPANRRRLSNAVLMLDQRLLFAGWSFFFHYRLITPGISPCSVSPITSSRMCHGMGSSMVRPRKTKPQN